ncbi:MAG: ATP-dependent 6-phosphofructokinase [Candidatus Lernaella stagnicola]|nr:ATP-dependent 6-phosphofructokinase [Candidatus Lernaella stagnicola]
MALKRIGILTGGGDCAGLNAVIRAITKCAMSRYGTTVVGIRDGFEGLLGEPRTLSLTPSMVKGLLYRGGTILGSSNKGDPFNYKMVAGDRVTTIDRSDEALQNIRNLELDALFVIGGDGTNAIGYGFFQRGVPVIGIPKTIDNDLGATDVTFGFDTAVNVVCDAIDRLQTTAESHHRVMIVETMGRNAGWIALQAGLAGGADVILIPEISWSVESVAKAVHARRKMGRNFTIICVAEGATPVDKEQVIKRIVKDSSETIRLGGIAHQLCEWLTPFDVGECRGTEMGHVQRGGTATAFDRNLCTRMGAYAVHVAARGDFGKMVVLRNSQVATEDIYEAIKKIRLVEPDSDWVAAARDTGVCFGDE